MSLNQTIDRLLRSLCDKRLVNLSELNKTDKFNHKSYKTKRMLNGNLKVKKKNEDFSQHSVVHYESTVMIYIS